MSARRPPAPPPELPGFTFIELLGSGGFADVYLYEQQLPRRRVAVKVLLAGRMSSGSIGQFTDEANVMAMLSTHPAIVTIYQAGVAGDGRPYLVMEYCPKPNLQARYRREPFSVAESLRVGVQVAAAVETAHRAGVLHRDIKPANILVTEYNRPALTDFGIASTTDAAAESAGLSIPWSPPESFADAPRSDVRSDVYALAATVYTLLAGRSPFELQGQRNGASDLIQRIERSPLAPLGRHDAPLSLQRTLERGMAKNPADRYPSALEFARALQKVQIELSLAVTPIDILDDGAPDDIVEDEDDGLTRVRGMVGINPQTSPAAGLTHPADVTRMSVGETTSADATVLRAPAPHLLAPPVPDAAGHAVTAQPAALPGEDAAPRRRSKVGLWAGVGGGVFLVGVIAVVAFALPALLGTPAPPTQTETSAPAKPQDALPATVAAPTELTGTRTGESIVWTWKNTDGADGDVFLWRDVSRADAPGSPQKVTSATTTQPVDAGGRTCIEVSTLRTDGAFSEPATECVP
ncbi:serine/threonine protein kinase [Microbacterium protaetiae]|uniref:non-specific serine/threonine protein kinase n=1 Tax=Microbacterium protaetiae TaxID=2509458 RepID=A0A4P6EPN4_9MICO|nr:serine/threonine-protein kinase [Microbacterium protaetiae]QAY59938.1 serine/threonine protein kinase [Microbacterium protaetiae]